ncbi:MAG TPA: hypothetical protein VNX18_13265 [Bryobacteraceae bacterium]|jgi:hypothetical protein|nr:hypothetical protein [Bryobacteraceae bacterium]
MHVFALTLVWAASVADPRAVEVQVRNVNLHLDASIVLQIRRLRGQMAPLRKNLPVTFDDSGSFVTRIRSAEIAIDASTIADIMNRYVFAYSGAPLKNIEITVDHGHIVQKGTIHKVVDLPFEVEGSLGVTPDGRIRLHADKVTSAHVPFKGLLHLFGKDLSRMVNIKQDRGVRIEGDDILLDPSRMLPPPHLEGKVTAVQIEGDKIVHTFGSETGGELDPPHKALAYIYHRGGVVRFGKLTMTDADMEIVSESGAPTFDFSSPEYNRQLVAGYSKSTPSHGLIVFMPDFRSLASR